MGWFDFSRSPNGNSIETLRIPIFPLNTVLFPDGVLPLKIFEQRYLEMTANCLKGDTPFGICLIDSGAEVGESAVPHPIGTLATIGSWDMEQLGLLLINAIGGRRFRLLEPKSVPTNYARRAVELLSDPNSPLSAKSGAPDYCRLLQRVKEVGLERIPEPHRYDDAWVGYRIIEILPLQNLANYRNCWNWKTH
jgi:uncharacterized protein